MDFEQRRCSHCGSILFEATPYCSNCGRPNPGAYPLRRSAPETIGELDVYCSERDIVAEQLNVYIEEDCDAPGAFGIYREGDEFVVYLNEADGTRKVRYHGPDGPHAVEMVYEQICARVRGDKAFSFIGRNMRRFSELEGMDRVWWGVELAFKATIVVVMSLTIVSVLISGIALSIMHLNGSL